MNITNFIREKVDGLKNEKSKLIKKHDFIDVASLILAVGGIAVGALCAFSGMWTITFPCIGFGAGMASLNSANRKKATARKNRVDKETTHLEKLSEQPFDVSRGMYQRRADKVASLSNSLQAADENITTHNVFDGIITVGLAATAVAGVAFGGTVLCAVPLVLAAAKGINDILCVHTVQKRERLKNRVDNISNDLDLQVGILQSRRNNNTRALPNPVRNNTRRRELSRSRNYTPAELEAVDSYVEDLAKVPEEKAIQKVKH